MSLEMPWPFTEGATEGEDGRAPERSPEGAELGANIVRFVLEAETQRTIPYPDRCGDCAGRLGTLPNQNAETLMNFLKCAMEGKPFYCHVDEPVRLCTAYVLLRGAS